ncbi:MAG TPA: DNA recombination protein RmuC, partial [Flammeovirgaceae bacterium]|nr:DNA recombination protein RmuC [Flammeovirgaceae bacterium]
MEITGVIVGVVAGMAAGGLLVWWLMRSMAVSQAEPLNRQIEELQEDNRELSEELDKARQQELTLVQEVATLRQALQDMKERQAENEKKLVLQFENLANRILENKSKTFTEQNEKNIHNLLQPLRERIERFAEKVEKSNKDHVAWNAALKQQIEELAKLNQRIDEEARNLTKALKGDTK